jgi:hypothetical protein
MAAIAYPELLAPPSLPRRVRLAPSRSRAAAVHRRRRLVVLALALAVVVAGRTVAASLSSAAPPPVTLAPAAASPVVVVQPGDTYWGIASSLRGGGDVRERVDALVAANGGAPLHPGDRITVPG